MKTIQETFAVGVPKTFMLSGHGFVLISTTAGVDVEFLGAYGRGLEKAENMRSFRVKHEERFNGVKITSAANQTVKFAITEYEADVFAIEGDIQASIIPGSIFTGITDVTLTASTPTQIIASNTDRKKVIINSINSNVNIIRVGDSGVSASKGFELYPGETREIETTAAIYGYTSGATQKITISEIKK